MLGVSVKYLVNHAVRQLVELSPYVRKGHLIELPYQLSYSFVDWPQLPAFYLI